MKRVVSVVLIFLLGYLLWWRWQVAQTRFFDVDEFSYLHWAANIAQGQKPYIDFFLIFTPGFLWVFAPLIKLFWMNAGVFVAARGMAFIIFLALLFLISILFGKTRNRKWMALPAVILAFLPMPYDKFLEVRPDNLATLFAFGALFTQIHALIDRKPMAWFVSGFLYTVSVTIFIKMLPFPAIGIAVAALAWVWKQADAKDMRFFVGGLGIPGLLLLSWMASLGDLGLALYSVFRLPFETNKVGLVEIMEPHLFFFPNASFYGGWGITLGLITNHALWVIGLIAGVYRFFTPYVTADGNKRRVLAELLIAGAFLASVYGYVQFFPLKHSQYLIPIALFIAYYAADWLGMFFDRVATRTMWGSLCALLVVSFILAQATINVNRIKLTASNAPQVAQLSRLITTVPKDAKVLDLEGKMLFWKDAYYICCVSFGSFAHFMTRQPPPLAEALTQQTQYIFQGESNRLGALPDADRAYIAAHYQPVAGWGDMLLIRK